jgi:hypothetical protein
MKRVLILAPLALATLAGCSKGATQIQAGRWEIVTELRNVEMPGAPAELTEQARAAVGRPETVRACLSDEDARTFVQTIRRGQPATCTVSDEVYAGGVMRTRSACPGPNGQPGNNVSLDGTFTMTTFNGTINEERPNPLGANQGPVRRSIVLRGRRLGACSAAEAAAQAAAPPAGH